MAKKLIVLKNQAGFTLIEVLMAITLFSVFITAYMASQAGNMRDSSMMREEFTMSRLCEEVINEILLSPPTFTAQLESQKTEKDFDKENAGYSYKIEYKKFKIPSLDSIMGKSEEEEKESAATTPDANVSAQSAAIQKRVFKEMQKYFEEAIWQVQVTVKNKETGFQYTLATWLSNPSAQPKIDGL